MDYLFWFNLIIIFYLILTDHKLLSKTEFANLETNKADFFIFNAPIDDLFIIFFCTWNYNSGSERDDFSFLNMLKCIYRYKEKILKIYKLKWSNPLSVISN